jgi:hypothetical protein
MVLGAALLLLAAAAPTDSPAGLYRTQQMEVAAALELQPNGHFRYALTYGAMDEQAEGVWTFDRTTVRLTTQSRPKSAADAFIAAFRNQPLERKDGDLLLERYDTTFRFVKVRP